MSAKAPKNIVASVRARLRTLAQQQREDFNFTLMRYANERFLYRLGQSAHRHDFVLKGAMLLPCWGAEVSRPTRDIDLLGFGDPATARLGRVFAEVTTVTVEPDGMVYHGDQLGMEAIRGGAGVRRGAAPNPGEPGQHAAPYPSGYRLWGCCCSRNGRS